MVFLAWAIAAIRSPTSTSPSPPSFFRHEHAESWKFNETLAPFSACYSRLSTDRASHVLISPSKERLIHDDTPNLKNLTKRHQHTANSSRGTSIRKIKKDTSLMKHRLTDVSFILSMYQKPPHKNTNSCSQAIPTLPIPPIPTQPCSSQDTPKPLPAF